MSIYDYASYRPERKKSPNTKWRVYLNGKYIDTVNFLSDMTDEQVKMSLVRHDGYPQEIEVRKYE